jgi:hypothetical protein
MAIASSIPAVIDALVELLEAATWPAPAPQICDSDPPDPARERITIGDSDTTGEDDQSWAAIGARSRDERYVLLVDIHVSTPGLTTRAARDRAFALLGVVEQTLVEHPTLDLAATANLQIVAAELRQPLHTQRQLDEGRGIRIESGVRIHARLRR